MTLFVFSKIPKNTIKMRKTVKNLDQFLTLYLDQFLTLEAPQIGPVFDSTAYIYMYKHIYIYISLSLSLSLSLLFVMVLLAPLLKRPLAVSAANHHVTSV